MLALLMIVFFRQSQPVGQRTEVLELKKVRATEVDAALVKAWPNVAPNVAWTVDTARNSLQVTGDDYEIGSVRHFISLMEGPFPGLMKVRYVIRRIRIPETLKKEIDWSDARNLIVGPGSDPPNCRYASIHQPEMRTVIDALSAEVSHSCDCSWLNNGHIAWSTKTLKVRLDLGTRVNGDKSISMLHTMLVTGIDRYAPIVTSPITRRVRSGDLLVVESKGLDFDIAITATLLENIKKTK